MKLLLDENISYRVLNGITDLYQESVHVATVGLQQSVDRDLWDYAKTHGLIIVTKDDDFQKLSVLKGHPPKVIWLDIGNCRTEYIIHLMRSRRDDIERFAADETTSLLAIQP